MSILASRLLGKNDPYENRYFELQDGTGKFKVTGIGSPEESGM